MSTYSNFINLLAVGFNGRHWKTAVKSCESRDTTSGLSRGMCVLGLLGHPALVPPPLPSYVPSWARRGKPRVAHSCSWHINSGSKEVACCLADRG